MFWNGKHSQDPRQIPPILERIKKVLPEAGTNFEPSDIPTLMQKLKTHPSRLDTNTSSQLQESLFAYRKYGTCLCLGKNPAELLDNTSVAI